MRFLDRERSTVDKLLPGLDAALAGRTLAETERPGSPAVADFRASGAPGLLVPTEHRGLGATALEAVRVQRAIGARSPSLAVATTMHHFSVASLVVLSETGPGLEWMVLEAVATGNKLIASGWAEGRPDRSILQPTMTAVPGPDGLLVSGVKRPCSLAESMDLLTGSVLVPGSDGAGEQLAVVLVPADAPGLRVTPFWGSFALAGAESHQVTLENVPVPEDLLVRTTVPTGRHLDDLQVAGFVWFELLIAASYLGAASGLVERVLLDDRVAPSERLSLVVELESAMAALEAIARQVPTEQRGEELLAQCLYVRYGTQDAIARAVPKAVELLGGMEFIRSDDVGCLAASVHGLSFHPPSRARMAGPLGAYLAGEPLAIA